MKLAFDRDIPLVGLGKFPWTRLGPEQWFAKYKIASVYGWDVQGLSGAPELLLPHGGPLRGSRTQDLIDTPDFQKELGGYPDLALLPYKPMQLPEALRHRRFLMGDPELSGRIENKAEFRQLFDGAVPFPAYRVIERQQVTPDTAGLELVLGNKEVAVVQDERLSGGMGTFIVRDIPSLKRALNRLSGLRSGKRLVVSEFIDHAEERSVQCCVTRYGVFVGPLQKQVVANRLLANTQVVGANQFCGGEINAADQHTGVYAEVHRIAEIVGERLGGLGYKGVFGMDCLTDDGGRVFVLEVNARLTGMTPLLTTLYRDGQDIPFYLLHILELGDYEYKIIDREVDTPQTGSMLIMYDLQTAAFRVLDSPSSGLYAPEDLSFKRQALYFDQNDGERWLIQRYAQPGIGLKAGNRLLTLFYNGPSLGQYGTLRLSAKQAVESLRQQIRVTIDENQ